MNSGNEHPPPGVTWWARFNPAVPRYLLFAIAGLLWTAAGAMLCIRGAFWLAELRTGAAIAAGVGSLVLAASGYVLMFSAIVRRNISRIRQLPSRACIFSFTAWRGYLMIMLMMIAGMLLRSSAVPRILLSIPYTAMGGVLLTGSLGFYREFLAAARGTPES